MNRDATLAAAKCLSALALGFLVVVASGCVRTQKWPGPMQAEVDPLPPGDADLHLPGPEEVTVVRHADPVKIRPAGTASGIPMTFYNKRTRMRSGGQVVVSPGGRAEVLWPGGTSIVMFGRGVGWIGAPSRGEAIFDFREIERARLELHEGDQVRLLGGALLSGASGPYLLERTAAGTLWIHNQSRGQVAIAFRDDAFELGPGQAVYLPLLSSSGDPFGSDQALRKVSGPGFSVAVHGDFEPVEDETGVRLRGGPGVSEREAHGLGVRVQVGAGEVVRFGGLESNGSGASDGADADGGPATDLPPGEEPGAEAEAEIPIESESAPDTETEESNDAGAIPPR